jgi:hypothetical protein
MRQRESIAGRAGLAVCGLVLIAAHVGPLTAQSATAAPALQGKWTKPFPWAGVAIHMHVLPDGQVLSWAREDSTMPGRKRYAPAAVWDPASGTFTDVSYRAMNVFCSGHSFLPDGRLLVVGGHIHGGLGPSDSNVFDWRTRAWTPGAPMNAGRWYPTSTTLGDGETLVLSGSNDDGVDLLPQVRRGDGTWRDLSTALLDFLPASTAAPITPDAIDHVPLYPRLHVAPDGRVLYAAPLPTTRLLDTIGTGAWAVLGNSNFGTRDYGSSVMYEPGKVLIVGGGDPPTATAEVIDLIGDPVWRFTQPMAFARRQMNATLLADGKVLVTGGTSSRGFNKVAGAVLPAELWDPATGTWTVLASMRVPRLYHSTAVLLPDGRVLSAGGGGPPAPDGDVDHPDAEIFSPPYLFAPDGSRAKRPRIAGAPAAVAYGQAFLVKSPQAATIAKVTWIRLSSVTHAFNMDQRFLSLPFVQVSNGVLVTAPADGNLSPPGYYLLFVLNGAGVPSLARIVRIG